MSLFGKKKNEYEEASQNLGETTLASDRIVMEKIEDNDQRAAALVTELKNGNPLIINFEDLEPLAANKLLAFFAGACFALDGRNIRINDKTYLFARKVDFFDGSLQSFLENLPKAS